ncbi:hypothetical protein J2X36_003938 [Methylobacterium sp. BE186]|uniref:hypothetical protein n=1 Tax=Methylobacterium sp. BE186 TaxID=2817715 RepID=UPI002857C57C|nr:hypothetical protein [Methylobacterium sp. BE186]MDR7039165.1 hypothetical protein [Methylobacterium sp. BE186]
MKQLLPALAVAVGLLAMVPVDAGAVVCARGVVRAGCVGPNAAVGVRRGYHGARSTVVRRSYRGPRTVVYRRGYRR